MLFAERYYRKPQDAVMIAANILGKEAQANPMLAINAANSWPNDPLVLEEIARLRDCPIPKRDLINDMLDKAEKAFNRGEEKVYADIMKTVLQAEGYLVTGKPDDGKGNGRIEELMEMVIDHSDRGVNG